MRASEFRAIPLTALLAALVLADGVRGRESHVPDAPVGPSGTWDVERVAVDLHDQLHWRFEPDDPRLLGRTLSVTATEVSLNTGTRPCADPDWKREKASLARLVADSYPASGAPQSSRAASIARFGIDEPDQSVTLWRVECRMGSGESVSRPWTDAWFAELPGGRLWMRYGTSALLELRLRPAGAVAKPSFNCGGTRLSASEQAICKGVELAAFDRSVAAAYARARSRNRDDVTRIEAEQKDWLRARNACAADETCLVRSMRERVLLLMQE